MEDSAKPGESFDVVPRSIWVFCAAHVLIGGAMLWLLITSRCIEEPTPLGHYTLDGCSAMHDPWRDGYAPYFLGLIILFIVSSLGLLRASRLSRIAMLLTVSAYFAYEFFLSVAEVKRVLDHIPDEQHDWVAAWSERLNYYSPVEWLPYVLLVSFDAWFLFGSRARNYFSRPPNTSLERTRAR